MAKVLKVTVPVGTALLVLEATDAPSNTFVPITAEVTTALAELVVVVVTTGPVDACANSAEKPTAPTKRIATAPTARRYLRELGTFEVIGFME